MHPGTSRQRRSPLLILLLSFPIFLLGGCTNIVNAPTEQPYKIKSIYSVNDPQFVRTMGNLLGPPLIGGNSTVALVNGDQIFPAMLDAIRSANKTITFETYVYWSGDVGAVFTDALSEKARQGVKVHVIIDPVGSDRIDHKYLDIMEKAGVQFVLYHGLKWYDLSSTQRLNNRTHRKLLIIDGEIGFTGGAGIADVWIGNADSPKHWRDTHYQIRGPAVAQLQAAFVDNWMETTGRVLHGDDYFPPLESAGSQYAQVFKSSAGGGSESMELMYLLSIAAAQKNIRLASAYFVPDKLTMQALKDARERGVVVQIIVPGPKIDMKIVRRASRARWGELLKAGVELYEYMPTMYHCKLMIVDDLWTSIGSANLDNRSFRMNDEANLNVLDHSFAQEQIRIFDDDVLKCRRISYEKWKNRPVGDQLWESFLSLFGPLM